MMTGKSSDALKLLFSFKDPVQDLLLLHCKWIPVTHGYRTITYIIPLGGCLVVEIPESVWDK